MNVLPGLCQGLLCQDWQILIFKSTFFPRLDQTSDGTFRHLRDSLVHIHCAIFSVIQQRLRMLFETLYTHRAQRSQFFGRLHTRPTKHVVQPNPPSPME